MASLKGSIKGLNSSNLKKILVVFGFEDVLVPGKIRSKLDESKIVEVLENLSALSKAVPGFRFFVVSGYPKDLTQEKLTASKLNRFFLDSQVRFVSPEYLASKEPVDREIYEAELAKNPLFQDEYFKQKAIEQIAFECGVSPEKIIFIGHDLWFDAFYTQRFSKADFVLVSDSLSSLHKSLDRPMEGLNYIRMEWPDIKKVLLGELPVQNLDPLRNYIQLQLSRELVSSETMGKLIEARKKQLGLQ